MDIYTSIFHLSRYFSVVEGVILQQGSEFQIIRRDSMFRI